MIPVEQAFAEQLISNRSALGQHESFREHRAHCTRLILRQTPRPGGRLCVLGAGNAHDLELGALLAHFAELHLVDIDADAVAGARARVEPTARERVHTHAPCDVSGMFRHLPRWARMEVTAQELLAAPAAGAKEVAAALPAPFDAVVSACLLTQLQLTLLQALGDQHQLFGALREFLSLTHLRTLAALTKPEGRALLITDLCEASVFPPGRPRDREDLSALMSELTAQGHVIHSSHPALLKLALEDDPVLQRSFDAAELSAPWLWENGAERTFLVFGLVLPRKRS